MRRIALTVSALLSLACAGLGSKDPTDTGTRREDTDADADADADGDADADADGDADADTDTEPDLDEDGSSDFEDCNDTDPTVYPGATEYCNGVDDDCDGAVDDDAEGFCGYASTIGEVAPAGAGCVYPFAGDAYPPKLTVCPTCVFAFEVDVADEPGACEQLFRSATLAYDATYGQVHLIIYETFDVGPFDAVISAGTRHDLLEFEGTGALGGDYSGFAYLY